MIAGSGGFSQSLSLSNQFGQIVPNFTIIQAGTPDSNTLFTYFDVKNTSADAINVLCKKTELSLLDSTQTFICWANFCYVPSVFISYNAQTIGSGETYSGFKGIYAQMAYDNFYIGESVVRWVFFDQENTNDSVSVTVRYQTFPVSIGGVKAGEGGILNIFPNPAAEKTGIYSSMSPASMGTILIQNMQGVAVRTQLFPPGTGNVIIDICNLCDGVYFCSLMIDGIRSQTKKLIVKH